MSTPDLATLRAAGAHEWMIDALSALARKDRTLDGHLVTVGDVSRIPGTQVSARCHFVARDGNGNVLVPKLARKLATQIVDYCIPPSRIAEARSAGSTEAILALQNEAQDLFVSIENSGEAGELLLYLLLEVVLELPQLLCKMSLKTSSAMHVHGADGIHGAVTDDGNLALYWGESKLHASVTSAIDSCIKDLAPFLADDGSGRAKRDLVLLREGLDLNDEKLVEALRRFLMDDAPESTRVEFRGAALVGFDLDGYPDPVDEAGEVQAEVAEVIKRWQHRISSRISHHELEKFGIEIFCVPFPSVEALRDEVRRALRIGS